MTGTYQPLATTTLATATTSVTFGSIPSSFRDLIIVFEGSIVANTRLDITTGNGTLDTGANYFSVTMLGTGSATNSLVYRNATTIQGMFDSIGTGTGRINSVLQFMDYSATDKHKTIIGRSSSASNGVTAFVARHATTSATNIIRIAGFDNITVGSTLSLYGIRS